MTKSPGYLPARERFSPAPYHWRRGPAICILAAGFLLTNPPAADAANPSWQVPSGNWTIGAFWTGGVVPSSSDNAYIGNGGTVAVSTPIPVCNTLYLGGSAASGTLLITGGSLTCSLANVGDYGVGVCNQSDGYNTIAGFLEVGANVGSSGTYILSGGQLSVRYEIVAGNGAGSFVQSGGTHVITSGGKFEIGDGASTTGQYILSDGLLSTPGGETIGSTSPGLFTQTGGTNNAGGGIVLGYSALPANNTNSGAYLLAGGLLTANQENVGWMGSGTITQTGGTNCLYELSLGIATGSSGIYNLSGTSQLSSTREYVGSPQGTDIINHSGGTNSTNALYLGYSLFYRSGNNGTYNLYGNAILAASNEYIACNGDGSVAHSAGTNSVAAALYIGYGAGNAGSYNLSGSGLLSAPAEYIGYSGSGTLAQSGGTNNIAGILCIG
jgi:fibronectin-binding autotransporter adhesin